MWKMLTTLKTVTQIQRNPALPLRSCFVWLTHLSHACAIKDAICVALCLSLVLFPHTLSFLQGWSCCHTLEVCLLIKSVTLACCWPLSDSQNMPFSVLAVRYIVPHGPVTLHWEGVNYHICTSVFLFIFSPVLSWKPPIMKL